MYLIPWNMDIRGHFRDKYDCIISYWNFAEFSWSSISFSLTSSNTILSKERTPHSVKIVLAVSALDVFFIQIILPKQMGSKCEHHQYFFQPYFESSREGNLLRNIVNFSVLAWSVVYVCLDGHRQHFSNNFSLFQFETKNTFSKQCYLYLHW